MSQKRNSLIPLICWLCCLASCSSSLELEPVSTAEFAQFVKETSYLTDAEKYGWSVVQQTVYEFETRDGANWRMPDGMHAALEDSPVTQVSYHDAMAYCAWAGTRLPSYEEYWQIAKQDTRQIIFNTDSMTRTMEVNVIGNTWDITDTWNQKKEIRLAGGSYLCSKKTCDGTDPNRKLYVSPDTGNSHISFSVLSEPSQ